MTDESYFIEVLNRPKAVWYRVRDIQKKHQYINRSNFKVYLKGINLSKVKLKWDSFQFDFDLINIKYIF